MKQTPLHSAHLSLAAKMGEFAGYDMPLYYGLGVLKEHEWVRSHCGVFDVSHMGQAILSGEHSARLLETLTPSPILPMKSFRAKYSVLINKQAGIVDDLIITRLDDNRFFIVFNAGCKEKDISWIKQNLPEGINFEVWPDRALVAVQGPESEKVLKDALDIDTSNLSYMQLLDYGRCYISRLGYTGEDGFELSVPQEDVKILWDRLLAHSSVKPIGLAARDSLRLEMGYCLYGHDIDDTTSPREADLEWVVAKDKIADFPEPKRKRVGVVLTGKGIAREGSEILNRTGEKIGSLSSGGFSPTLKQSIGQGYVPLDYASEGTEIQVNVRGNFIPAKITKMPFLKPRTKTGK